MAKHTHNKFDDIQKYHHKGPGDYEYFRRELVTNDSAEQCSISFYELPPGKSSYPYHYHIKNEEAFYIIKGKGVLKTPVGKREVSEGDFLFFPANEKGAHKLTNTSENEPLLYLDFGTRNDIDVCFYPDSSKFAVWGKSVDKVYNVDDNVGYYDRE